MTDKLRTWTLETFASSCVDFRNCWFGYSKLSELVVPLIPDLNCVEDFQPKGFASN